MSSQIEERISRLEKMTGAPRSTIERLLNGSCVELECKRFKFKAQGIVTLLLAFLLGWAFSSGEPIAQEFLLQLRGSIDYLTAD